MRKFLLLLLGFTVFLLGGCSLLDPVEQIPSYIQINQIDLQTDSDEGSNTHKITDAWVFVNGQLLGAFNLPATIPVLEEGEHEIAVFAGILENGILSTRDVYPFYERYRTTNTLVPGEILTINPVVTYNVEAEFAFIEDFENSNRFGLDLDGNPNTKITATTEDYATGQKSGHIVLSDSLGVIEVTTNLFYTLGELGQPVYLEFDYKNNIIFDVGIIGLRNGVEDKLYKLSITEKEDWNKIYISFKEEVALLDATEYKIVFLAIKPNDVEIGEIFIDNIKLVYL